MFKSSIKAAVVGALTALSLGCQPPTTTDFGDVTGVEEISEPLAALGTAPTFATGTLTVTLASGETCIISKHAVSGNILVNVTHRYLVQDICGQRAHIFPAQKFVFFVHFASPNWPAKAR
jgi:hypothetical protein